MSDLVQVRKKAQLTLPQSVRQELGIEEGDFLDIQVKNGEIVLKVKKLVDKEQAWFWTRRWQQGEKEAQEDIDAGRVHHFPDAESAVDFLNSRSEENIEDSVSSLTHQEMQILKLISEGDLIKQIAAELGISSQTIKKHLTSIRRKLNANARTEAVAGRAGQDTVKVKDSAD
jgi:AbrB family looped-hinge helix DNA binding protein